LLAQHAGPLTDACVEVYHESQEKFTPDIQSHYIYSPRELSRWFRAMYEAIEQREDISGEDLVRLWAHEGLRLFQDRLTSHEEREWTDAMIDEIAGKYFPGTQLSEALKRPLLFSRYIKRVLTTNPYVNIVG